MLVRKIHVCTHFRKHKVAYRVIRNTCLLNQYSWILVVVCLFLLTVPVLQQQTVADVILELSPRPRIQEASPRKIKAESATVLTASPHKRFLEDKAKQLLRELRKQKETSDTEESCGATEKGSSRFQNHNKHPKRALLCYRWGLDTVPAVWKVGSRAMLKLNWDGIHLWPLCQ